MSEESRDERYADVDTSHLDDLEDGCGCTEMWEHTSEREAAADEAVSEGSAGIESDPEVNESEPDEAGTEPEPDDAGTEPVEAEPPN